MIDRLFYATALVALSALFALTTAESVRITAANSTLAQAPQVVHLERVVITARAPAATVAAARAAATAGQSVQ